MQPCFDLDFWGFQGAEAKRESDGMWFRPTTKIILSQATAISSGAEFKRHTVQWPDSCTSPCWPWGPASVNPWGIPMVIITVNI